MTGYVYILNGKVVINPEEKPKEHNFVDCRFGGPVWNTGKYMEARKEWESNCTPAQNAETVLNQFAPDYNIMIHFGNIDYGDYTYDYTSPGSQVEHDGPVITKIY